MWIIAELLNFYDIMLYVFVKHGKPDKERIKSNVSLSNIYLLYNSQVSSSQAKRKIAESTETPIEFLAKYDELKGKKWVTC